MIKSNDEKNPASQVIRFEYTSTVDVFLENGEKVSFPAPMFMFVISLATGEGDTERVVAVGEYENPTSRLAALARARKEVLAMVPKIDPCIVRVEDYLNYEVIGKVRYAREESRVCDVPLEVGQLFIRALEGGLYQDLAAIASAFMPGAPAREHFGLIAMLHAAKYGTILEIPGIVADVANVSA